MPLALLLLPALAALLLAAHWLRAGAWFGVVAALVMLAALAVPRAWAARLVQCALVLGAVEWLHTLIVLRATRAALGQPTLRLTLILLIVAAFTAACAAVFHVPQLRRRYRLANSAGQKFLG